MNEKDESALYNHVKKEQLLSKSNYNELKKLFFCDKDTKAYRGFSFRTKREYDRFKELLDSGEYRPKQAESFSRDLKTAEDFSRNKKTFFFYEDHNIALENTYKQITDEAISVYAGVVVETTILKGDGVDVNKSDQGIEDEIIFQSDESIEYTYRVLNSYENQLKENPLDLNKHIQDNGIEDPLSKYIMSNHQDEITKKTQLFILENLLKPLKLSKSMKSYYVNEVDKNVVASETDNSFRENDRINVKFHFSNILKFYKKGVFTDPTVLAVVEESSNKIIDDICTFVDDEYNYSERDEAIYYDLSDVNELSYLAGDNERERLKSISWMATPKHYDDINDEIRELNYRTDLSREDKDRIVRDKTDEIKDFIISRLNGTPKEKAIVEEEIEKQNDKNEKVKTRMKKLRGS